MSSRAPVDHIVSTYLTAEDRERVRKAAQSEGLAVAAHVRRTLLRDLAVREAVRAEADAAPPLTEDQAAILSAAGLARRSAS